MNFIFIFFELIFVVILMFQVYALIVANKMKEYDNVIILLSKRLKDISEETANLLCDTIDQLHENKQKIKKEDYNYFQEMKVKLFQLKNKEDAEVCATTNEIVQMINSVYLKLHEYDQSILVPAEIQEAILIEVENQKLLEMQTQKQLSK